MSRARIVFTAVVFAIIALVCSPHASKAECIKRALTSGEQTYYEQVTNAMEKALPAPDDWRRQVIWMNVPKTVCEGFEKNPVLYGGQFKFMEITEVDRMKKNMAQEQQALEDNIIEATNRGDIAEASRLQGELQRNVSANLETLRKAQVAARNGPKPGQMIAKFRVNEKRKTVGKKYVIAAIPQTARTFERINAKGTDRETITKMLYIGRWRVEDFIKNWNLFRPEVSYDAIGSIRLELTGKRPQVEDYISSRLGIGLFESAAKTDQ